MNRFKSIQIAGLYALLIQLSFLLSSSNAYGEACSQYYITGFKEVYFETGRMSNGHWPVNLYKDVQLPKLGADTAIVALTTFALSYGKMTAVQEFSDTTTVFSVGSDDHELNLELVSVSLAEFTGSQAKIHLMAVLSDKNGDDKWNGLFKAQVIFLKCFPAPSLPSTPPTPLTPFTPLVGSIDTLRVKVDSLFQLLNKK
jgi:hypothetical protein